MESMIDSSKLECVDNKCSFSIGVCVSSQANSSGLGFWWKDQNISLKLISYRHIFVLVEMDDYGSS